MIKYEVEVCGGTQRWFKDDKLHREDGPAVICGNGYKAYYINGDFHRDDGPAVVRSNGYKAYYVNGKCHREDGPAIVRSDGFVAYRLNGECMTKEEHARRTAKPLAMTKEQIEAKLGYPIDIVVKSPQCDWQDATLGSDKVKT